MDTSLNIKSIEQGGRKLQKTITDVNPNADGTALKTFAQGLNSLTTNTYAGTTKINIDNLLDEDSGSGSGKVNPLPAPTVIRIFATPGHDYPDDVGAFEFADAAATWTGALVLNFFGFVTNSTGNLNVTGTPANATAVVAKFTDAESWMPGVGYDVSLDESDLPDIVKNVQNPVYWIVFLSLPDYSSADCLGDFTCVFNATDTYSSATVHVNVTGIGS